MAAAAAAGDRVLAGGKEAVAAEALAATLCIVGRKSDAASLLEAFGWGQEFLRINAHLLDAYAACETSGAVVAVQNAYLERCEGAQAVEGAVPDLSRIHI